MEISKEEKLYQIYINEAPYYYYIITKIVLY